MDDETGIVTGLLGSSGSGKSTLILTVVVRVTLLALALGAATLRRRTA